MADVFVYDAVRTPRGRGKKDGSLHEVPAVRLGAHVLGSIRDRRLRSGEHRLPMRRARLYRPPPHARPQLHPVRR